MSIAAPPEASSSITHFRCKKDFVCKIQYVANKQDTGVMWEEKIGGKLSPARFLPLPNMPLRGEGPVQTQRHSKKKGVFHCFYLVLVTMQFSTADEASVSAAIHSSKFMSVNPSPVPGVQIV